jgi:hypothetical protein
MSLSKIMWMCFLVAVVAFPSFFAFAIPVRQSSENGQTGGVDSWTLLGRTVPITLTANGKKVTMTRQVICPQQDRLDGSCYNSNGNYTFLFQLQSTSANVTVSIGKLQGFTAVGGNGTGTYGVMICDDANNYLELCTEDPNDPDYTKLSGITFQVTGKTSVSFTVPSFPSFPAGIDPAEGQGLTLFIMTQQSAALPIAFPTIGIH